jgi:multiple sugar transport system permease protein
LAVLLLPFLSALFPFVYMFLKSLEQTRTLSMSFNWSEMSLSNYQHIITNFDFMRYTMNSLIVSGIACALNCLVSSLAAFGFEKKRFPGREAIFYVYLATLMIPGQVTLIPVFVIMKQIGLLNSYPALFLPIVNAFGVFLVRQFMVGLPDELLEAANIDGSGELRTFFQIVLPLSKPVLISLVVFTFISTWNDFVWPLVDTSDAPMHTLTLALSVLKGNYATNYGLVMAGATLTFSFPVVLYQFPQRQFVEGIALSGVMS